MLVARPPVPRSYAARLLMIADPPPAAAESLPVARVLAGVGLGVGRSMSTTEALAEASGPQAAVDTRRFTLTPPARARARTRSTPLPGGAGAG